MEIPRARNGHDGRARGASPYLDSWAQPDFIRLDGDYDGSVANPHGDPTCPNSS